MFLFINHQEKGRERERILSSPNYFSYCFSLQTIRKRGMEDTTLCEVMFLLFRSPQKSLSFGRRGKEDPKLSDVIFLLFFINRQEKGDGGY